jgi:Flp pilus assembly protein TadG
MKPLRRASLALSDERGSFLVVGTLMAAVLILLGTVIIEVGHGMEHRRHLQVQTDAAALAAAQAFPLCSTDPADAYGAMSALANQYGGFSGANQYNQQVGTGSGYAGTISALYQSRAYPAGGTTIAQDPDNIFNGTTQDMTCGTSDPTSIKFFDVKATEAGVHNVFNFGLSTTVHAHSRVELKAVNEANGLLPLAVPDVRPRYVFAKFIAETGTIACTGQTDPLLDPCEEELLPVAGTGLNGQPRKWAPSQQLQVTVPTSDMGIRIRFVGGPNKYAACGQLYVECYDEGSTNGVVHVRGWNTTAAFPRVEDATLLSSTCSPDPYFTVADCDVAITANVNLGPTHPVGTSQVWATIDGAGNYPLTVDSTTPANGLHVWTSAQVIPIRGGGPHEIRLNWQDTTVPCTTNCNFGAQLIQRPFEASFDRSAGLPLVQVFEGTSALGPYSYQGGTQHSLGVTVMTLGNLLLSKPTDPPINLRVFKSVAGNASQDQSVDCDPAIANFKNEIAMGCAPLYKTQTDLTCPFSTPSALWASAQPWTCVATEQGDKGGLLAAGLNLRIFGKQNPSPNSCVEPNMVHWIKPANAPPGTNPGFDETKYPDDKRVLPLFVTPLGTFSGSGQDVVPLIDFGYFYVTGYEGDPCQAPNRDPNADLVPNGSGNNAIVLGHFIKFFPLDDQHVSDDNCDLTTITPCVGVLTR